MEEIVKILDEMVEKRKYAVLGIFVGMVLPENLLFFIWNRDLYLEMDVLKLFLLSLGIGSIFYFMNFIVCMNHAIKMDYTIKQEDGTRKKFVAEMGAIITLFVTMCELIGLIFLKIYMPSLTIKMCLNKFVYIYSALIIFFKLIERYLKKKYESWE